MEHIKNDLLTIKVSNENELFHWFKINIYLQPQENQTTAFFFCPIVNSAESELSHKNGTFSIFFLMTPSLTI